MNSSTSLEVEDSAQVTRASQSNLAFAFACLSKQRRQDMNVFYAFCRAVDDIADDPVLPTEEKRRRLASWMAVIDRSKDGETLIQRELMQLLQRYPAIEASLLREIVLGMEMDLGRVRYETYEALEKYCFRVACAVGLVSIEIFGARTHQAQSYAVELGHALQLVNIIRDTGEDLRDADRIYLPQEDLATFQITEEGLRSGCPGAGFRPLMELQCRRAKERFAAAKRNYPERDAQALRASELMRRIYETLLWKIERDGFRVLERRYRLGRVEKAFLLLRSLCFG